MPRSLACNEKFYLFTGNRRERCFIWTNKFFHVDFQNLRYRNNIIILSVIKYRHSHSYILNDWKQKVCINNISNKWTTYAYFTPCNIETKKMKRSCFPFLGMFLQRNETYFSDNDLIFHSFLSQLFPHPSPTFRLAKYRKRTNNPAGRISWDNRWKVL